MPRPQSFRDLLELHERQLRDLVDGEGDAPERVWAAWVLALRHDPNVLGVVRHAAAGDPSPGVRAHMALLLVAHGELSAAMTLARTDPSDLVRASACRHLARVAKAHDLRLQALLEAAMRTDPSANVHAAIADAVRLDASEGVWRACVDRLGDPDEGVRANVIEALLRRHAAGESLARALTSHATIENSPRLRSRILVAWVNSEGSPAVIRALAVRPVPEILNALQFIQEEGKGLEPDGLDALLALAEPAIDASVAALHRLGIVRLPRRWLLEFVIRFKELLPIVAWSPLIAWRWDAMQPALEALAPMLATTVDVPAGESDLIRRLRLGKDRRRHARSLRARGASTRRWLSIELDGRRERPSTGRPTASGPSQAGRRVSAEEKAEQASVRSPSVATDRHDRRGRGARGETVTKLRSLSPRWPSRRCACARTRPRRPASRR